MICNAMYFNYFLSLHKHKSCIETYSAVCRCPQIHLSHRNSHKALIFQWDILISKSLHTFGWAKSQTCFGRLCTLILKRGTDLYHISKCVRDTLQSIGIHSNRADYSSGYRKIHNAVVNCLGQQVNHSLINPSKKQYTPSNHSEYRKFRWHMIYCTKLHQWIMHKSAHTECLRKM